MGSVAREDVGALTVHCPLSTVYWLMGGGLSGADAAGASGRLSVEADRAMKNTSRSTATTIADARAMRIDFWCERTWGLPQCGQRGMFSATGCLQR